MCCRSSFLIEFTVKSFVKYTNIFGAVHGKKTVPFFTARRRGLSVCLRTTNTSIVREGKREKGRKEEKNVMYDRAGIDNCFTNSHTKYWASHSPILIRMYIFICWINSRKLINHTLQIRANKPPPPTIASNIDLNRITEMPTAWLLRRWISHTHSRSRIGFYHNNTETWLCILVVSALTHRQPPKSQIISARTKFEPNTNFRRYIHHFPCYFNHRQFQAVFARNTFNRFDFAPTLRINM